MIFSKQTKEMGLALISAWRNEEIEQSFVIVVRESGHGFFVESSHLPQKIPLTMGAVRELQASECIYLSERETVNLDAYSGREEPYLGFKYELTLLPALLTKEETFKQ